ncbi:hypothetical protein ACHAPU_001206 [Fusarium lateritium]
MHLVQKVLSFSRDQYEGGTTKVHDAIRRREGLQEALKEQPWALDTIDDSGDSPLQLATLRLQIFDMKFLLSAGANVNQQKYDGISALMIAASVGDLEAVTMLLKAKGSVSLTNDKGSTPLFFAVYNGNEEVIRLLLTAGASATDSDIDNSTILHHLKYSSATYDIIKSIIGTLVMAGADLEAKDCRGSTPILTAMTQDNLTVIRCMVEAGCSLSSFNFQSHNLLHFAAVFASLDTLEYFLSLELSCINPFQKTLDDTPWDYFVLANTVSKWDRDRGVIRKPNLAEQEAFVELYQGVRDRWLKQDIYILEQIFSALRKQDVAEVRKNLASLIEKETSWENDDLASWYRAVDKRVQHMEWELATEDVEECLLDMRKELDTPVWEVPSIFGGIFWDDGHQGLASGGESSNSD